MTQLATTKPRAYDIPLSKSLYRDANDAGVSLSQYLERLDPSENYGPHEQLDAFERQIRRVNEDILAKGKDPIVLQSIPEKGIWASKVESFYTTSESALLFPEYINRTAREALVAEDDILSDIVAIRTPIDSNAYKTIWINTRDSSVGKRRVTEGAEMPVCEMKTSDNMVRIYKYGRRIKATYEAIRRMRIDMFALTIRAVMLQAGLDRATEAYNVLINGDGSTKGSAAEVYKKTDLQGGTASDALGYAGWIKFLFKFYPYKLSTLIGGEAELVHFLTMAAPNVDPLKLIEQLRFGRTSQNGAMKQNIFNNYNIVYLPESVSDKLVALDNRYALEMVTEIGSDITETDKIIASQWQEIAISEANGFAVLLQESRRILNLNA